MNLPIELLLALSLAGQQVTENLFGPHLKAHPMVPARPTHSPRSKWRSYARCFSRW